MVRFCEFSETLSEETVFVNPASVVLVRPFDEGSQILLVNGQTIGVDEIPARVVNALLNA